MISLPNCFRVSYVSTKTNNSIIFSYQRIHLFLPCLHSVTSWSPEQPPGVHSYLLFCWFTFHVRYQVWALLWRSCFREAYHKTSPGRDTLDLSCDLCKHSNELSIWTRPLIFSVPMQSFPGSISFSLLLSPPALPLISKKGRIGPQQLRWYCLWFPYYSPRPFFLHTFWNVPFGLYLYLLSFDWRAINLNNILTLPWNETEGYQNFLHQPLLSPDAANNNEAEYEATWEALLGGLWNKISLDQDFLLRYWFEGNF